MKRYKLVGNSPVARFYYKGNHSHPIRRTVLIVDSNDTHIVGYEVREGSIVRTVAEAPVKTYSRVNIAKWNQLGACKHRTPGTKVSTLKRTKLDDFLFTGP